MNEIAANHFSKSMGMPKNVKGYTKLPNKHMTHIYYLAASLTKAALEVTFGSVARVFFSHLVTSILEVFFHIDTKVEVK